MRHPLNDERINPRLGTGRDDTPVMTFINADSIDPAQGDNHNDSISQDGRRCPADAKIYIGVGFTYNPTTWVVIEAPTFFPAYRAGLRPGDQIVTMLPDDLPEDVLVNISVNRGKHLLNFQAVTRKICYLPPTE